MHAPWIKFLFLAACLFIALPAVMGQVPAKCFEIESILVDACVPGGGCTNSSSPACNCEGKNEMVRFRIGPAPVPVSGITISWPNNTFLGFIQDATTAGLIAQLNASIQSCGWLIEPQGGILPAGKQVLLITSTDMCVTANSFATLTDTLLVIFQNAGNYQGHFANHNNNATPSPIPTGPSSTRTLIFTHTLTGCADTVTYDRSLLVNTLGTYGGSSAQNDGATVDFSWPGVPSYINRGCQAPFVPLTANAGNDTTGCSNTVFQLNGSSSEPVAAVLWQGGTGTFSNAGSFSTTYTPGVGENGNVTLTLYVVGLCGDTVAAGVTLTISPAPLAVLNPSGPQSICPGDSLVLAASGGTAYLWSTGATNPSITVNAAGTYSVIVTNSCGTDTAGIVVSTNSSPTAQITAGGPLNFCAGDSVTLTASGGTSFAWSTGATSSSITVNSAGSFTVAVTSSCGTDTAVIATTVNPAPFAQLQLNGPSGICPGDTLQLTASGGTSYLWSTGDVTPIINVTAAGTYSVLVTNSCGSDTAGITVNAGAGPQPLITGSSPLCPGDSVLLSASGGTSYLWSNGNTAPTLMVTAPGTYSVIVTNSCGSAAASFSVAASFVNAAFTADSLSGLAPLTVSFTNQSSGATGYSWNFGDNSGTSTAASPAYSFSSGGVYTVTLTVVNADGCTDTAMVTIVVNDAASTVSIPNVFTPNGDGINDVLLISSTGLSTLETKVFDRWGVLVYESQSVAAGWDGRTVSGLAAADGTYYYVLSAEGFDGKAYQLTGFITLIH